MANTGASIEVAKSLGGWLQTSTAEEYIETSLEYRRRTGDTIVASITDSGSASMPSAPPEIRNSAVDNRQSCMPSTGIRYSVADNRPSTSRPSTSTGIRISAVDYRLSCMPSTLTGIRNSVVDNRPCTSRPSTSTGTRNSVVDNRPSTVTRDSLGKIDSPHSSTDPWDDNDCVASQGYFPTADDTIEDSLLSTFDHDETNAGTIQPQLRGAGLSFSNCKVTIHYTN